MQILRLGPGRQFCHGIQLPQQLPDDLAGIVSLTKLFDFLKDSGEGVLGLRHGDF